MTRMSGDAQAVGRSIPSAWKGYDGVDFPGGPRLPFPLAVFAGAC